MKSILALPAILGAVSAAAVPRAQSPCVSNGRSTAPEPAVNTLAGFNESANYSMLARNAVKPEGYELIMSDTKCALSSSKYMRYSRMSSYDSQTCAKMCDSHPGCDTCTLNPYTCLISSASLILFKSTSTSSVTPLLSPMKAAPTPAPSSSQSVLSTPSPSPRLPATTPASS